jgi:DNA-binding GntR family transcriptional regulator
MTDAGSTTSDSLLGDFTIDRRKSMVDQAHTLLQNAIIFSKLPPGQVLKERELCDILSISRTPIREALLRLQEDGLVEIFPQAGTYVSRISIEAVHESQFIRVALEMATVGYAARHGTPEWQTKTRRLVEKYKQALEWEDFDELFDLDEQFHRSIAEFRFRDRLWKMTNSAKAHMDRVRRLSLPYRDRRLAIAEEHTAVLDAIITREEAQAVEAMRRHLNTVFRDLERVRTEHGEYFVD